QSLGAQDQVRERQREQRLHLGQPPVVPYLTHAVQDDARARLLMSTRCTIMSRQLVILCSPAQTSRAACSGTADTLQSAPARSAPGWPAADPPSHGRGWPPAGRPGPIAHGSEAGS